MLGVAARLEQRNRALRAQELPGQVDRERALPVGERDVLARGRGPGDARVVDERVEAAERAVAASSNSRVTAAGSATSHTICASPGSVAASAASAARSTSQMRIRAPSRANARAVASPMPERAGGDQHAQSGDVQVHDGGSLAATMAMGGQRVDVGL